VTTAVPSGHGFHPHQEEDDLRARPIVAIGIAGILVTVASAVVAGVLLHLAAPGVPGFHDPSALRSPAAPTGTLETSLLEVTARGTALRAKEHAELEHYRRLDGGFAQIPIERAMDIVVTRAAHAPAGGAGGPP
jgi:hypothetical protein